MVALVGPAVVSTLLATLAMTGHLELWHVALGNLLSGTLWASEMSTRRRMVGEVAGPHRIVNAIALDSATSAATRMIGPLLGGLAFETLHMSGAYTLTALVQFAGAFAMAGLVHPQITRRLNLARIPAEIAEGLAFARTKPTIVLVFGITIVTNAFGFAYSGLVAPLGIAAFDVSPALVGLLAAGEPLGALLGGALIAAGFLRMDRRLAFAGGAALFMAALIVMALSPSFWLAFAVLVIGGFGTAGFGNMQSTLMLTEAPPEMRSQADGHRHGLHRHRAARHPGRRRDLRPDRAPGRGDRDGGDRPDPDGGARLGVARATAGDAHRLTVEQRHTKCPAVPPPGVPKPVPLPSNSRAASKLLRQQPEQRRETLLVARRIAALSNNSGARGVVGSTLRNRETHNAATSVGLAGGGVPRGRAARRRSAARHHRDLRRQRTGRQRRDHRRGLSGAA